MPSRLGTSIAPNIFGIHEPRGLSGRADGSLLDLKNSQDLPANGSSFASDSFPSFMNIGTGESHLTRKRLTSRFSAPRELSNCDCQFETITINKDAINKMQTPIMPEKSKFSVADNQPIDIGSTVTIRDLQSGEVEEYTLVTPNLADITQNRISSLTPVGRAIYGRHAGETVDIDAPGGIVQFRIERHYVDPD